MGRKRKRHLETRKAEAEAAITGAEPPPKGHSFNNTAPDPPARLLALHPIAGAAVAYGKTLAVALAGADAPVDLGAAAQHGATLRALAFDPTGAWLLSADDSKTVRLWRTADWTVAHTFTTGKKPSCGAFGLDGAHAYVGDRFGDVMAAATAGGAAAPLLGHYCSTITSLAVSPDGRCLATADRDNKVRVSLLPAEPLKGAHEIQSYCLGHEAFVTCSAFVQGGGVTALVTASGDGSVRLWNHLNGEQLAELQLVQSPEGDGAAAPAAADGSGEPQALAATTGDATAEPAVQAAAQQDGAGGELQAAEPAVSGQADDGGQADEEGVEAGGAGDEEQQQCRAVTVLAVSPDNSMMAAAVEGRDDVAMVRVALRVGRNCGRTKGTLELAAPLALAQMQLPTSLVFDMEGRLWAAGGPLRGEGAARLSLAVARPQTDASDCQRFEDVSETAIPAALAAAAEACTLSEAELQAAQQQAEAGGQLGSHLKKKVEDAEKKRQRQGLPPWDASPAAE